ncbi:hypothetical protein [Pedobacter frigiditerrae]|uniref:hypothetical protein n=1 Tax=Pedobacter frigiditerrae TaxID=2530452 RepID=UPI00292E82F7|nr:hypothetical protein [Pedobacter frigiditerrae]
MKWTFLIVVFFILACNRQIKFDKKDWATREDMFPCACREFMVEDLKKNYKLTGISEKQLIKLLGKPDLIDTSIISYELIVDYGYDIDPIYIKSLDFKVDSNKNVINFEIKEWKK